MQLVGTIGKVIVFFTADGTDAAASASFSPDMVVNDRLIEDE